jgi:hypothetical protein
MAPESAEAARAAIAGETGHGSLGAESDRHVRLVVALGGTLQRSHLHVANVLNFILHTSESEKGVIDAAAAYSVSPATKNQRIVIGDKLTLQLNVGWYAGDVLHQASVSKSSSGGGGGFFTWLFGVLVGAGICYVWLSGTDGLPKSIRTFVVSRLPGKESAVLPKYNGYAFTGAASSNDVFSGGLPKKD